jgi:hypothetical protein
MDYQAIADPLLDLLEADTDLTDVVGTAIYYAGERDFAVPSLEWQVISDPHEEDMGVVITQVDLFARTMGDIATMQSRVQFHWDQPRGRTLQGVYIESMYEGGGPLPGADEGVFARFLTFRHRTVRERYT